jgi:hypothetical protein
MSAVPGDFMNRPVKRDEESRVHQQSDADDSGGAWWQWLAIGLLVGCWLAEATWCMERGY